MWIGKTNATARPMRLHSEMMAPQDKLPGDPCSIARALGVLGERWTLLILREAIDGTTRFAEFREALGVASDVLSERLATLVTYGVMTREPYRDPGHRVRHAYKLTQAGRELHVALGALQLWGDRHLPRDEGPTIQRRAHGTGRPVHVAFVDDRGREIDPDEVAVVPMSTLPRDAGSGV
jgi:DNA-binding HxlR family transcriptional regulator